MHKRMMISAVMLLAAAGCQGDASLDDADRGSGTSADSLDEHFGQRPADPKSNDESIPDAGENGDDVAGDNAGDSDGDDSADDGDDVAGDDDADMGSGDGGGETSSSDAAALVFEAADVSAGRSVRGSATVESSFEDGSDRLLTSHFEFDASGALSMEISDLEESGSVPSDLPLGSSSELRYTEGAAYVGLPVDESADLGIDVRGINGDLVWLSATPEWLSANPEAVSEIEQPYPLMMLCRGSHIEENSSLVCDPLAAAAALIRSAVDASVIGDEEVFDVPTTKVGFTLSMLILAGMTGGLDWEDLNPDADGFGGLFGPDGLDGQDSPFGQDALRALFDEILKEMVSVGVDAEIWIDEDKLIRRLSLNFLSHEEGKVTRNIDASSIILTGRGQMHPSVDGDLTGDEVISTLFVFDFHDFDADINVTAPSAELVVGDFSLLVP